MSKGSLDYLDTLPKEALVVVLSNMSFEDVYSSALISKRFASVINTYSFRKAFALKHKGEWMKRFWRWFQTNSLDSLEQWLPILIENDIIDPSFDDNTPIAMASDSGYTNIVKILLADRRVNPAISRNFPIIRASKFGHTDVVKLLLLDQRVDPSAQSNNAIIFATENGHVDVVKLLLADLRVAVSLNDDNKYIMRVARMYNHEEIVNLLEDYFKRRQ